MELELTLKLEEDKKLHNYLLEHTYWYRLLNRDSREYENLVKEYKKNNREKNINKINETIENAEMISNIVKFVE